LSMHCQRDVSGMFFTWRIPSAPFAGPLRHFAEYYDSFDVPGEFCLVFTYLPLAPVQRISLISTILLVATALSMLIPPLPPFFICSIIFAQKSCPCFPSEVERAIATNKLRSLKLVGREHPWPILSPAQIAIHKTTTPKCPSLSFAQDELILLGKALLTIFQWCRQSLVIDV